MSEALSTHSLAGYKAGVTRSGLGLSEHDLTMLAITFGFIDPEGCPDAMSFEDFAVEQQAKANARRKAGQ